MRLAIFELSRLIEDEENLHTLLVGGSGKDVNPEIIDLVPGIPTFCKLECTPGALSPIIINLQSVSTKDNKKIRDLEVFGSYHTKEPSAESNNLHMINPSKIEIYEERKKKKFKAIVNVK